MKVVNQFDWGDSRFHDDSYIRPLGAKSRDETMLSIGSYLFGLLLGFAFSRLVLPLGMD